MFKPASSCCENCHQELPDDDAYVAPDDPADLICEVAPQNLVVGAVAHCVTVKIEPAFPRQAREFLFSYV